MSAVAEREIEVAVGAQAEGAEAALEIEVIGGSLRPLTAAWEDVQRTRLSCEQRGIPVPLLKREEDRLGRQVRRVMEQHPIWPWLSQYPGLGGMHTARLVAIIGDPHRFPGRRCSAGHHHSVTEALVENDDTNGCGVELPDGMRCPAPVGPVRRGNGTRSLWHYCGLHPGAHKRKGQQADWNTKAKTAVLMPGGIAEQIVRQRVPKYRDIYEATKGRLIRTRAVSSIESDASHGPLPITQAGTELEPESDQRRGPGLIHPAEAVVESESEQPTGLRPFQIEAIARKYAAKQFVADLLAEMKRVAADGVREIDHRTGGDTQVAI